MPDTNQKGLIIEIDKKLGILISSVESNSKRMEEFRGETKTQITSLQDRVRTLELTDASQKNTLEEFKAVKQSLIKWLVGVGASTILAAYVFMSK